ncbi:MAG: hypothetical protein ABS46_07090 [Cytophagaceae bacterium SCN 52-12]|nr:MAG: hypothetical protein ABS46_07090 [Cytophagaceae bacterium SCN 52-12]
MTMSTAELKISLINKITGLTDNALLEEIMRIVNFETDSVKFELNSDQKNAINIARAQIQNNEYQTNEQVEIEMQKWLEE